MPYKIMKQKSALLPGRAVLHDFVRHDFVKFVSALPRWPDSFVCAPSVSRSRVTELLRADVFQHLFTRLLALAAFLSALFHVRVALELFARVTAALTGVRTRLADRVHERPLAGDDAGSSSTVGGAILTGLEGLQVILLPLRKHPGTVVRTGVAHSLAVIARFGTRLKGGSMVVVPLVLGHGHASVGDEQGHSEGEDRQSNETHRMNLLYGVGSKLKFRKSHASRAH